MQRYRQENSKDILVATDVAARGLDINNIDVVIQFQIRHVDSLVHRTGRTGRANKSGTNIMLIGKSELKFMKQCEESLRINIDYVNTLQGSEENEKLIEKEVEKVIKNAHIPTTQTNNHVDRLVKFYEAQDDEIKSNFFRNVMTQLMHVK